MVKYTKEFEFPSSGPRQVRGYMRGGASCGYAKGGAAKAAPKGLSVMIAMNAKKAAPSAKKSMPPVMAVAIGKKSDAKMPVKKAMGGMMKGKGAITDAEAKQAAGAAYLAAVKKRKGMGAMTPMITPDQRRAMNNETMIGRKKGGMVKC